MVDIEASARACGALVRARKLGRAEDLLRLALLYGPAGLSLRATAEAACALGMADRLSDKAVLGRLRRMGDWLEHILRRCSMRSAHGWAARWPWWTAR